MKRTDGPWKAVHIMDASYMKFRIVDQQGTGLALALHLLDAQLIATAPELLEALKEAVEILGSDMHTDKFDKVINKAEGKIK